MASGTEEAMKKSRFSEEKMVKILRETDKVPVTQVAKKHGVSEQTIYAWRKRFGKLEAVDVKRLRQLEQENAKLKKLVAERDLEIDVMKEVARKKWWARAFDGSRSRTFAGAGSRFAERARCFRLPGRPWVTSRRW
jgi:DNA-binding transcriptional regulator YiaG